MARTETRLHTYQAQAGVAPPTALPRDRNTTLYAYQAPVVERSRADRTWIRSAASMGVLAGVVSLSFQMMVASFIGQDWLLPLRLTGAIVSGDPQAATLYTEALTIPAGILIHLVLSAFFGALFGLAVAESPAFRSFQWLVFGGAIFGLFIWLINYEIIAPLLFPWFSQANTALVVVAHTIFFGATLGLLLTGRAMAPEPVPAPTAERFGGRTALRHTAHEPWMSHVGGENRHR